jgi:hypothetical protein
LLQFVWQDDEKAAESAALLAEYLNSRGGDLSVKEAAFETFWTDMTDGDDTKWSSDHRANVWTRWSDAVNERKNKIKSDFTSVFINKFSATLKDVQRGALDVNGQVRLLPFCSVFFFPFFFSKWPVRA